MGADADGGQAAVVGVLAMVRAVVDGAVDALVGGALAAVVGAVLHGWFLLHEKDFGFRRDIVCPRHENLCSFPPLPFFDILSRAGRLFSPVSSTTAEICIWLLTRPSKRV